MSGNCYVGSTVVSALLDAGDRVVGLDDLSRGHPAFLARTPHYVGDVADEPLLDRIFAEHPEIEIVIHCAARTQVQESTADPLRYYRTNVGKAVTLFERVVANGCTRLVFSSSAAVYGDPVTPAVTEDSPVAAASPYAATKLMVERILDDLCAAGPVNALSLRYFNPIGADPQLRSGSTDPAPPHVLGRLIAASVAGEPFWIHGDDWDTPDGTPIRDFVHVADVARAHVVAAHRWSAIAVGSRHQVINIGSGRPTTVRELAEAFNRVAARPVTIRTGGRRPGDTVGCYADTSKARRMLGWAPRHTLADGIRDALRWADELVGRGWAADPAVELP